MTSTAFCPTAPTLFAIVTTENVSGEKPTINNYAKNVFMYTNHGGTSAIPVIELSFFAIADISLVTQVDVEGTYSDVLGGAGAFTVDSVYRTPWIDMGDPARDKRWRRPQFIMSGGFE